VAVIEKHVNAADDDSDKIANNNDRKEDADNDSYWLLIILFDLTSWCSNDNVSIIALMSCRDTAVDNNKRILVLYANLCASWCIRATNSRVGPTTIARGSWFSENALPVIPARRIWVSTGSRNATVLPDPVWAQAMRSRPRMMMGIAHFCIGVGLS